jgi:hypothetical protein
MLTGLQIPHRTTVHRTAISTKLLLRLLKLQHRTNAHRIANPTQNYCSQYCNFNKTTAQSIETSTHN